MFINCYANAAHEARAKEILSKRHPDMFVSASHELSQEYREFERCLDGRRQRLSSGRRCAATSARSTTTSARTGFKGSFLIVQSTGGLYESEQAQIAMRAHAGIRSGGRRDRHAGALPHARHRERHRLRHGRHHREGRRHLQGRGADHGRGADRRLRQGAADADRHDGHLRGRHRRRLDRARSRTARCASARRARARSPGPACYGLGGDGADRHRRQPDARPARRRPLPRRRDEARRRRPPSARSPRSASRSA